MLQFSHWQLRQLRIPETIMAVVLLTENGRHSVLEQAFTVLTMIAVVFYIFDDVGSWMD